MNPRLTFFVALKLLGLYVLLRGAAELLLGLTGILASFRLEGEPLDRLWYGLVTMSIPTFQCVTGLGMVLLAGHITVILGFAGGDEEPTSSPAAPGKAWYAAGLSFAAILALLPAWNNFVHQLFMNVTFAHTDGLSGRFVSLGTPLYLIAPVLVLVFAWPLGSILHNHHRRMLALEDDSSGDEYQGDLRE